MPFEPLGTDEKSTVKTVKEEEFEGQMMAGCTVIGLGSVIIFVLTAWPWLIVPEYRISGLFGAAWMGLLPSIIFGAFLCLRFGLAGGSALAGGSLVGAIFMYLRLEQSFLRDLVPDVPAPDYPENFKVLLPLAWIILSFLVAGICVPAREYMGEGDAKKRR